MEVVSADATPEIDDDELIVAGPQSPLALLRAKRTEMDKGLFLDLAVPRRDEALGVRLWVRYKPGDPSVLAASVEKREKSHANKTANGMPGDPDRMMKANADFLVDACIAVYTLPLDEEPPKDGFKDGEYPTFSTPELSEAIGAGPSAVETCRTLYATPGDLMVAANLLLDWSGKFVPKADKDSSTQLEDDGIIETAAVALNCGWDDPMKFIDLTGTNYYIAVAIVRKSQELQNERRKNELKYLVDGIGASVGNRVAEILAKAFR